MLSVFSAPSRYVQGKDATEALGEEMRKLGLTGTALVLAGRAPAELLSEAWTRTLGDAGIDHALYRFGGECSRPEVDSAKEAAVAASATVVVGAGGGKVLDTARAVASELELPVVNCPTIASSDSPCSALSVVYTPEGEFAEYVFYPRDPDLVLVDTAVVARAPLRLLVAGLGDALATWFEARTVIEARSPNQLGGATTIAAGALAELCCDTLLEDGVAACRAVEARSVTPALERIVEANTLLSGLGFESGGLAVAHSVHNGLTELRQTHSFLHGEKVSFGLLVQLVLEGKPTAEIERVLRFQTDVGLPVTLEQVGVKKPSDEDVGQIAQRTVAEDETAHHEPFEVTAAKVFDAVRAADAIGRAWRTHAGRVSAAT